MRSFIQVRFQGHPVIVKEITMLMVTERVDPGELDSMRSRLADTESALKESKTSQKRSKENYNTLKRSLDNLMNDFRTVKAKVTAAKL
jgi:archaellum component FlaC